MHWQRDECVEPGALFQPVVHAPDLSGLSVAQYDRDYFPIDCSALAEKIARGRRRLNEQIARLAYDRAVRRGFAPGHELDDWLAAEAEVLRSVP